MMCLAMSSLLCAGDFEITNFVISQKIYDACFRLSKFCSGTCISIKGFDDD